MNTQTNVHQMPQVHTEHPKAREARANAQMRLLEKQKIKKAIAEHGVHFHVEGVHTFCYKVDRRNVIEVSTAVRSSQDHVDVHVGRVTALERFAAGQRILLRMPNDIKSPRDFLAALFMYVN